MKADKNTIPRRYRVDLFTPVEKMIYECQGEVEKMGADVKLTDALNLLIEARHKIAEFIDDTIPIAEKQRTNDREMLIRFMVWYKNSVPIGTMKQSRELVDEFLSGQIPAKETEQPIEAFSPDYVHSKSTIDTLKSE